jgi:hypothetical protein
VVKTKKYLITLDEVATEKLKIKLAAHGQKLSTFLNIAVHEELGYQESVGIPDDQIKMNFSQIKHALKMELQRKTLNDQNQNK